MKSDGVMSFDREFMWCGHPLRRIRDSFEVPFALEPIQERIILDQSPRIILNSSRQTGKTTTAALKIACESLTYPGMYLLIAPTERQAVEFYRQVSEFIGNAYPQMEYIKHQETGLELPNHSRVIALPARGENIRGFKPIQGRLVMAIDEAAFVKEADYRSCRPFLSHGGKLLLMSTPFGKRGFFYDIWTKIEAGGAPEWSAYSVKASECSHIKQEFLDEERMALGPWWYQQEYECQFLDNIAGFFDMDAVRAALDVGVEPYEGFKLDGSPRYTDATIKPYVMGE